MKLNTSKIFQIIYIVLTTIWIVIIFSNIEFKEDEYGTKEVIHPVVGFVSLIYFVLMGTVFYIKSKLLSFSSMWSYNQDHRLVAYVIVGLHMVKMEREDAKAQFSFLKITLKKRFNNETINEVIEEYLNLPLPVIEALNWLNKKGGERESLEVFDFLVDLAYYNEHVNRQEMGFLFQAGKILQLDANTIKSIFGIREQQRRKREEQKRENTRQTIRKGKNYYKNKYLRVLGLSSDSDFEAVRKAYRKLARELHPDRFVRKSNEEQQAAHERFTEINIAHEKLKELMES